MKEREEKRKGKERKRKTKREKRYYVIFVPFCLPLHVKAHLKKFLITNFELH